MQNKMIGKYVVVRCEKSGVFSGTLKSVKGSVVEIENVRKLYYWSGACAVEQLALDGVNNPSDCKFTVTVNQMIVSDMIQTIPCTEKAKKSLVGVSVWKA